MTRRVEIPNPRGLRRPAAAAYVGVSATKFDQWVEIGLMPAPKKVDGCVIWDVRALDLAFDDLPDSNATEDTWAEV